MPRAGLNTRIVVEDAARLADEVGLDRLTLAGVAGRLGVALPSLYKHVKGLEALRQKVSALATGELADALATAAAGRSRGDAVRAVAEAYRDFGVRFPGRYLASQQAPDPGDPVHLAAADRAVGIIVAVLAGYGLAGEDAIDATRALRSALHGFLLLELGGGFGLPLDTGRSYGQLVAAFDRALQHWPALSPAHVDG